jgi:hypothetical protein
MLDTQASGWFEAIKTPREWIYALCPDKRVPMRSLGVFLCIILSLIVAGACILGHYVSMNMNSGRDAEHTILAPVSLAFLIAGSGLAIVL